ncbi:MAG TPA: beta-ketoacyl-[acyl-carrier-protein] synthase family protein [Planctomycetaceae bacterium]|nr:beta-ketoacyl-[acyl-carrier-protein] synthase family protein [Planctomycetaceae bacterium]
MRSERSSRGARVVVTGIGLVTPLGGDRETSWRRLACGERAVRWISARALDPDGAVFPDRVTPDPRFAGAPCMPATHASAQDPVTSLALAAAREAAHDARLELDVLNRTRIGCVIGTSKGGLRGFARFAHATRGADAHNCDHEAWPGCLPHAPAAAVCAEFGLAGPVLSPVAACATGLASLNRGFELVRDGACDVVLAGSSDASLVPSVLASFRRLGVLATRFESPADACRPFDRNRDGFVVGEGAAVLVLERLGHARERGAVPYAEWLVAGAATDPKGLMQLDDDPAGLAWLIGDIVRRAGLSPRDIDYINLHGTATRQNDVYETRAIRAALGDAAGRVSCSSLKGAIGHLLGAAGSVEMGFTILALRDQLVPPTANLDHADPLCNLDYTPHTARPRPIETALKLSLGFGGHLVAAVIRRMNREFAS